MKKQLQLKKLTLANLDDSQEQKILGGAPTNQTQCCPDRTKATCRCDTIARACTNDGCGSILTYCICTFNATCGCSAGCK